MGSKQKESYAFTGVFCDQLSETASSFAPGNFSRSIGWGCGCITIGSATDFAGVIGSSHQTVVHPVLDHRFAVAASTLGKFVFVVWEDQVQSTAVDIEGLSEDAAAHG